MRLGLIELLVRRNALGLLSKDINSTMRLSVRWEDVWCRVSS